MDVAKFKIWDYSKRVFVQDPVEYVTFSFLHSPADQSILAFPVLLPGALAFLLSPIGRVDMSGVDIFEGDRIRFYSVSQDAYLQETVIRRSGLVWSLGEETHFEDALQLEILGHAFDGKEDLDLFKLFHSL